MYCGSISGTNQNVSNLESDNGNSDTVKQGANSTSNSDVGFSPFIGETTTQLNFRSGPGIDYPIIMGLATGVEVWVYSSNDINGFYKVIEVQSNKIGWVNKYYVRKIRDADVNESGVFQSSGNNTNNNCEVEITNQSSYTLTIEVAGYTFTVYPNSSKTESITPGSKYYIASAPGVLPSSGNQNFENGHNYTWTFWVETK